MRTVLLTGATGYIGRRLEKILRENDNISLRLLVRNAKKLSSKTHQHAQVIEGDTFSPQALRQALQGVDTAFYLIHSMGTGDDFSRLDRISAENFLAACRECKVRRLIYLGGLGNPQSASKHLASRIETGKILSRCPQEVQTIWFRAGVIIGSGSTSFEIIRHLVEKLPVMITPRWVHTLTQPIGINDVLAYLNSAIDLDVPQNLVVDIGMPPMPFLQMLQQTAQAMGLRRYIMPVPLLSPKLSSYWLALVTPIPYRVGSALVEGLKSPTLVSNDYAQRFFPHIKPLPFPETVREAVAELVTDQVLSRWCDSTPGTTCDISDQELHNQLVFRDIRITEFSGVAPKKIFASLCGIGGEKGWLSYDGLWQVRGFIDKMIGGCGLNRGRRHSEELRIGDALDFWTVVDLVPNKRLLLQAQMKLPGKAWLEFDVQQDRLVQTAHFIPHGLWGRLYWYAVLPFHARIFPSLSRKIIERAMILP
ncbi:MAG: SDR family oxidoreductase [Desulfobulbus sp.]|nr:SDR family oxidoreductase [Desulfobulbus sp.]